MKQIPLSLPARTLRTHHWVAMVLVLVVTLIGVEVFVRIGYAHSSSEEERTLSARTVIEYEVFGNAVRYAYLGEPLPEKLDEKEVIGMRTEKSYSVAVSIEDEVATLTTISYPQKTFAQDIYGVWHYIEYAVAPRDIFFKTSASRLLSHLARQFIAEAVYAATATVYSTAGGDGYIEGIGSAQSPNQTTCMTNAWTNTRGATTGTVSSAATTFLVLGNMVTSFDAGENLWTCDGTIDRGFLPFDTSSIASTAVVSSATLNVYATAKTNGDNDGTDYITVIETTTATHSSLATGDFDNVGTTEGVDAGERKDISSITTSAYLVITLNATGLTFINVNGVDAPCSTTNGISCFGLREGHDNANSSIAANATNSVTFSSADHTGTTQDPYLSITYTIPSAEVKKFNVIWAD